MQRLPRGGLLIQLVHIGGCAFADAQAAKQLVSFYQLGPEDFGQFTAGQAAHDFHLKQPVLRLHITQRAVHIELITGANMRHAALVVTHGDRLFERIQLDLALTRGQLALYVPDPSRPLRQRQGR